VDIVRVMEASPLATARRLAKSADRVFLDNNGITRDDLADLIGETFPDTKA
jgi:hypothetical protein